MTKAKHTNRFQQKTSASIFRVYALSRSIYLKDACLSVTWEQACASIFNGIELNCILELCVLMFCLEIEALDHTNKQKTPTKKDIYKNLLTAIFLNT